MRPSSGGSSGAEAVTADKLRDDFVMTEAGLSAPGTLKPRMPYLDASCAFGLVIERDEMLRPLSNGFIYASNRL